MRSTVVAAVAGVIAIVGGLILLLTTVHAAPGLKADVPGPNG